MNRLKRFFLVACLPWSVTSVWADRLYHPNEGVFAIEVEDQVETDDWTLLTEVPGFSGSGFFRWDGGNFFAFPGKGFIKYRLNVERAGTYGIRIHNYHGFARSDEHNDVWVRFNDGDWIKIYNHATFKWNWISFPEGAHNHPGWNHLLEGENIFEISGRSNGFAIDRVHLFHEGTVEGTDVETLTVPLSEYTETASSPSARFVGIPNVAPAPVRVQFDLSLVQLPAGRVIGSTEWDFGDLGAISRTVSPSFVFSLPGTYPVKLTVKDDRGNTVTHESLIQVTSGASSTLHIHEATSSPHYGGDRIERLLDENSKTRWSINEIGGWANFDLGGIQTLTGVELAFFRGSSRIYRFDLLSSQDGAIFEPIAEGLTSSGVSDEYERFGFAAVSARHLRIVGRGNDSDDFTQITKARTRGNYQRQGWLAHAIPGEPWITETSLGRFHLKHYPWVFHETHGFFYPNSYEKNPIWAYGLVRNSWSYLGLQWYPWIYDMSYGSWIYLLNESTEAGNRYAYVATLGRWIILEK